MPRLLFLTDDRKRDAQVAMESAPPGERYTFVSADGRAAKPDRLIKATEQHTFDALQAKHPDPEALAAALVAGDPEIDVERVGRRLARADRVWIRRNGTVLYAARTLQVVYDATGAEKSRGDFSEVEATVKEDVALPFTGRLVPLDELVRKFVFVRNLQIRHVNGLTFEFLYDLAKTLDASGKALLVGAGAKGAGPLIFSTNGAPYRGFLEGRVQGDAYKLVLHLSNLELKAVIS